MTLSQKMIAKPCPSMMI